MTLDEILRHFGLPPPPPGKDRYYTRCPKCSAGRSRAHQKSECLGITIDDKGVRFGCNHCNYKGGKYFNSNGKDHDPVVGTYEYVDESGNVLFRKIKTASKKFWIEHSNGHGGWVKGMGHARKILYRLPETLEAIGNGHPILIVEGEKDADNLHNIGVPATCNFDGASEPDKKPKWRADYSEVLRDADLVIVPDHDPAGYAHADAIASTTVGIAKSVRMLKLAEYWPQCPKGGDVSDWLADGHQRAEFDTLIAQAKPWIAAGENESALSFSYIDIARDPIPPREWLVRDRIPARNVTMLSGEGAIGKSILLLQLSVATVLGRDWIGTLPNQGPVIYLSCEDDDDEVRRRLEDIAVHYTVGRSNLQQLHVISLAGKDGVLGRVDRSECICATPLLKQLQSEALSIRPRLIVIDTVADVFAGRENDRSQTRQFITLLRGLAIETGAAMVLASHPSLTGISSDTGLSGSTAWHNSVRSRMYFKPAPEVDDDDLRVLEVKKNNYGPVSETIVLRWRNGVYVPEPRAGSLEQLAAEAKIDSLFLDLLRRLTKQGRNVSDKAGTSYAPAIFAQEPEAKKGKVSKKQMAEAMTRLFAAGRIRVVTEGSPTHRRSRIVEEAADQ